MAPSGRSGGRAARARAGHPELDVASLTAGWRRTEVRGGREWSVQAISATRAVKSYVCPGCGGTIAVNVAHLVVWRADELMGDDAALAGRRHWHEHCWAVAR